MPRGTHVYVCATALAMPRGKVTDARAGQRITVTDDEATPGGSQMEELAEFQGLRLALCLLQYTQPSVSLSYEESLIRRLMSS
jgi:hypothetical protein